MSFRGLEPKTQSDIVDQRYPKEDSTVVELDSASLPGLKMGFDTEEKFASFVFNTLRMRRNTTEWHFSTNNFNDTSLKWQKVIASKDLLRYNWEQKSARIAELLFSNPNCASIKLSVESGLEVGIANGNVSHSDMKLRLKHRNLN